MDKYRDVFESRYTLYEAKDKNVLATLEFSFGKADDENKNGRTYPDKVFRPAVEALGRKIESAKVPGNADHPYSGGGTRLSDVSHILSKVWYEDGVAMARADLLKTTKGKDTLEVIQSGTKIGASLRGFGEVGKDGKVKPGLEIKTVDLVVDPSFPTASINQSNVIESYIPDAEDGLNEVDQFKLGKALSELSDSTFSRIQEMLEKDGAKYSIQQLKAFPLYLKELESDPNLPSFYQWFREQVVKFGGSPALSEGEQFQRQINEEKKMSGAYSGESGDRFTRIQKRQKEIDEALTTSDYDRQTISRLYAEAKEAGFPGDKKAFIEKFGF